MTGRLMACTLLVMSIVRCGPELRYLGSVGLRVL